MQNKKNITKYKTVRKGQQVAVTGKLSDNTRLALDFGGECVFKNVVEYYNKIKFRHATAANNRLLAAQLQAFETGCVYVRRTRVATLSAVQKLTTRGFRRGGDALVRHVITQVFQNHGTVGERSLSQLIFTHRSSHLHRWQCSESSLVRLPWMQGRAKGATSSFVNVFLMAFFFFLTKLKLNINMTKSGF